MKFEIGDRVRVYSISDTKVSGRKGRIYEIRENGILCVMFFSKTIETTIAHPKQCRKLKKKRGHAVIWIYGWPTPSHEKLNQTIYGYDPGLRHGNRAGEMEMPTKFIESRK